MEGYVSENISQTSVGYTLLRVYNQLFPTQRSIGNLVKHLKWRFLQKFCLKSLPIFGKSSISNVWLSFGKACVIRKTLWKSSLSTNYCPFKIIVLIKRVVLRDLVPIAQFKKGEKHLWSSVTFSKIAGSNSQLY